MHEHGVGDSVGPVADVALALTSLLAARPDALVAAVGPEGRLVAMPPSVPPHGHRALVGRSGLDLVVPAEQMLIIDGWTRANREPIVAFDVHLQSHPDQTATVHLFDVRPVHGVHIAVVVAADPEAVLAFGEATAALSSGPARVRKDAAANIQQVDAATTALLGWEASDLEGQRTVDFIHPDDVGRAIESWVEMRGRSGSVRVQLRHRHARGHYVWLEVTNENRLDDPDFGCVVSELVDISAQMAQIEALHDRERVLGRLAEALPIGICHLRLDRVVVYSNALFVALLGPTDSVEALVANVDEVDRHAVERAVESALQGRPGQLEVGVPGGFEQRQCELTFRPMTSDGGNIDGVIVCAADVTERTRLRAELEHRASHDALSGCLNRAAIVAALERSLRLAEEVAVVYIDLDHLKVVNDELGHAAGDELLRVAAARLRGAARLDDQIGRIGGDEFVVICRSGGGPLDVVSLVDRFSEAVNGDVVFAKRRAPLRASIGAATSRPGELDAEAVLTRADAAMYEAKRNERARAVPLRAVPGLGP